MIWRGRAAAEAKDRRVSAVIAQLVAVTDELSDDIEKLRAALREVDRRDR